MPRSLKIASQHIQAVKTTLPRYGFPRQQDLAEALGISRDTVSRFLNGKAVGYLNFIEICHALELEWQEITNRKQSTTTVVNSELSVTSIKKDDYYVERFPIEKDCCLAMLQPGSLIRLKAPHQMGKSLLASRILEHAKNNGCYTVYISFQLMDKTFFTDLDKFLRLICCYVSQQLNIPNKIVDYWEDLFGSKISAKIYFETYILSSIDCPLALAFDEVDILFSYPDLADDFFGLLRAWHEEGKNREIWKKLRLLVIHSSKLYIPFNVNHSPFNVGIAVVLPEFTYQQVKELAQNYQINLTDIEVKELMKMVGGKPYLLQLAFKRLRHQDITLKQLIETAPREKGIYQDHLRQQLFLLQHESSLLEAFKKILIYSEAVELDLEPAINLQSTGLIKWEEAKVTISNNLYRQYFSKILLN